MKVNVERSMEIDFRELERACLEALRVEGVREDAVISLTAMTAKGMEDLNRRFMRREGPTDVIAFPMGELCEEGFLLGDVVICPEIIQGRREEYGVARGREAEYVALHGLLHLLGYDDEDDEGWRVMDKRQREIMGLR